MDRSGLGLEPLKRTYLAHFDLRFKPYPNRVSTSHNIQRSINHQLYKLIA